MGLTGVNIVEIPPKAKEHMENSRGSLPPATDADGRLEPESSGVVRPVACLENHIGYWVEDEELVGENFATVRTIGELLKVKARGDLET